MDNLNCEALTKYEELCQKYKEDGLHRTITYNLGIYPLAIQKWSRKESLMPPTKAAELIKLFKSIITDRNDFPLLERQGYVRVPKKHKSSDPVNIRQFPRRTNRSSANTRSPESFDSSTSEARLAEEESLRAKGMIR